MDSKVIIHKTKQDYNLIASYFSNTRYDLWPELKPFVKYIKNGQNILDWGCGNGRLLSLLKNFDVKYFGVDQSDGLLKIARQKWSAEIKAGKAKFFSTSTRAKNFPANFFDMVFMIASFHHLPDEKIRLQLLKKVYQEMNDDGKIIITVWNLESDWAKKKRQRGWKVIVPNDFLIPWKNNQGQILAERYYHHFKKEEIKNLLHRAGFKNIKINDGIFTTTDNKNLRNLVAVAEKIVYK